MFLSVELAICDIRKIFWGIIQTFLTLFPYSVNAARLLKGRALYRLISVITSDVIPYKSH